MALAFVFSARAQPVTGYWTGKLQSTRLELKLIKKGDSLVGTSYYFNSPGSYRRYSVRGYFDDRTNNVVWWDEQLLEEKAGRQGPGRAPLMMVADFNCPGEDVMKLDGGGGLRDDSQSPKWPLHLQKTNSSAFPDEWDYVINNYTRGASDAAVIDSVSLVALGPSVIPSGYESAPLPAAAGTPGRAVVSDEPPPQEKTLAGNPSAVQSPPPTVQEKFSSRAKILQTVIPVRGDSVELRFYDNAEIDGDSIAIFLNGQLVEEHILLTDRPHVIKIPVDALAADNELVMVAENLGSIPPNTSLMVALVGENRYEARLQSSEGSSALVRFVKESSTPSKKE